MAECSHKLKLRKESRVKLETQFDPIYAQDAGKNIAVTDEMCLKMIIEVVVSRADLMFQGEDGVVIYRPSVNASSVNASNGGKGHLNIDCNKR